MHSITVQPPLICSLAEVLLITVHAPVLLSSGATAVQKIVHINTHMSTHLTLPPFLLLFACISYPLQNIWQYTRSLLYLLLISIDTASRYSSAYWLFLHCHETHVFMCNSSAVVLEPIVRKRVSWKGLTSRENSNSRWEFFPGRKASE